VFRHPTAVVGAVLAALLLVSGCTSGTPTDAASSGPAGDVALPTVGGTTGKRPVLTFPDGAPSATLVSKVLVEGHGATVRANDLIVADYLGQVWDGKAFDSSYDRGSVLASPLSELVPGWADGLAGTHVGSRVLLSLPPSEGYGANGNTAVGITGTDTIVFVVDILGSFGTSAAGEATATPVGGPSAGVVVSGNLGEPASIRVVPGATQPLVPTTTVLAAGSGAPLVAGQALVQTAATDWQGTDPGSTWDGAGPTKISVEPGAPFAGLVGVPVGSRVVVLVPASGDVPAVASVVDVLAQV
jgi:peptidylprolyl isomerase